MCYTRRHQEALMTLSSKSKANSTLPNGTWQDVRRPSPDIASYQVVWNGLQRRKMITAVNIQHERFGSNIPQLYIRSLHARHQLSLSTACRWNTETIISMHRLCLFNCAQKQTIEPAQHRITVHVCTYYNIQSRERPCSLIINHSKHVILRWQMHVTNVQTKRILFKNNRDK